MPYNTIESINQCRILFVLILFTFSFLDTLGQNSGFKSDQQRYVRVRQAYGEKYNYLDSLLGTKAIQNFEFELFLQLFKKEQLVEIWVKPVQGMKWSLLHSYPFCSTSGDLGPKRRQGDQQIPEGFYTINRFNPASNFYLSLGLDYPNQSDRILSREQNPGGDIFIHGDCVTIGCVPITDDKIKEVYLLAIEVRDKGQDQIPVYIFPFRMTTENMNLMLAENEYSRHFGFWQQLKPAYTYFNENARLPSIQTDEAGNYRVSP